MLNNFSAFFLGLLTLSIVSFFPFSFSLDPGSPRANDPSPALETEFGHKEIMTVGNYSLDFDGTDDVLDLDPIPASTTYSVEFWMESSTTSSDKRILSGETPNLDFFTVAWYGTNVRLWTGSTWTVVASSLSTGTWYHFAFSRLSSTEMEVFFNGTSQGVFTVSSALTFTDDMNIGAPMFWGGNNYGSHYHGKLDELRIWEGPLAAADVSARMNTELNGGETDLVAYYKFDDDANANDVEDCAPNGYHASRLGTGGSNNLPQFDLDQPTGLTDVACGVCSIPPVANCQDITVQLNVFGDYVMTGSEINNGSNHNCGTGLSLSVSQGLFQCGDVGNNIVTLTVTDDNGNTDSCTANVFVEDNQVPTVTCQDITVYPGSSGTITLNPNDLDGGSTDNCNLTFSASPDTFTCADGGVHVVTLTVTDDGGNTNTCTANVTVDVGASLQAVCQDITVSLDASGNATIVAADVDGGSIAPCGTAITLSIDQNSFNCSMLGNNVVELTATDGASNTSTCSANVFVQDIIDPIALCQDITVSLDASGNASITPAQIDAGSSDICNLTLSLNTTLFDCSQLGPNNIILTVTDDNGNTATCQSVVTVEDNLVPTLLCQDVTIQLNTSGNYTLTPAEVDAGSTDNCSAALNLSLDQDFFDCDDAGTTVTVNLTGADGAGNSDDCTADVTILGGAPIIVCQDITITLPSSGFDSLEYYDILSSYFDCTIDIYYDFQRFYDCSNIGTNIYQITAINNQNLSSTCFYNLTVLPPSNTVNLDVQDVTVHLGEDGEEFLPAKYVFNQTSCACDSLYLSQNIFDCADVGVNTITAYKEDTNGNVLSESVQVTVQETNDGNNPIINPYKTFRHIGDLPSNTVNNQRNFFLKLRAATTDSYFKQGYGNNSLQVYDKNYIQKQLLQSSDHKGENFGIAVSIDNDKMLVGDDHYDDDIGCFYFYEKVNGLWEEKQQIVNPSGNRLTSFGEYMFIIGNEVFVYESGSSFGSTKVHIYNIVGSLLNLVQTISFVGNSVNDPGFWVDSDGIFVTAESKVYKYEDLGSGYVQTQIIDSAPANQILKSGNHIALGEKASGGNFYGLTHFYLLVGNNVIPQGNVNTGIVYFQDEIAAYNDHVFNSIATLHYCQGEWKNPTIIPGTIYYQAKYLPEVYSNDDRFTLDYKKYTCQDETIFFNGTPVNFTDTQFFCNQTIDVCDGPITSIYTPSGFDCSNTENEMIVTIQATDSNGNTASCDFEATILEFIAPTIVCNDLTIQIDEFGLASTNAADVTAGSTDNCYGIFAQKISQSDFDCSQSSYTIDATVYDDDNFSYSGNYSQCMATITVEDNIAPTCYLDDPLLLQLETGTYTPNILDYIPTPILTFADLGHKGGSREVRDAAVGDLDRDGDEDILLTNFNGRFVYLNDGLGGFTQFQSIPGTNPVYDIELVDLDNDGYLDLLTQSSSPDWSVEVFMNDGTGQYIDTGQSFNNFGNFIEAADFDEDGFVDFMAQNNLHRNLGNGTFEVTTNYFSSFSFTSDVEFADLNGDGSLNQATARTNTSNNLVIDGAYQTTSGIIYEIEFVDVDQDNDLDIIGVGENFDVWQNDGSANFTNIQTIVASSSSDYYYLDFTDIDFDGDQDAIVGRINADASLMINDGAGNFTETVVGNTSAIVALWIDADGDGDKDIFHGTSSVSSNKIYMNESLMMKDNCTSTQGLGISVSTFMMDCTMIGIDQPVDVTVSDDSGNTSVCQTNIRLFDNNSTDTNPPIAQCQDITVNLNAAGLASITYMDIDAGSTDDCLIVSYDISKSTFRCPDLGTVTVTLSVTDASGNVGTCNATVTVEESIAPIINCQDITVQLDPSGNLTLTEQLVFPPMTTSFNDTGQNLNNTFVTESILFDMDNDGDLDLAFAGEASAQKRIYKNDGTGIFTLHQNISSSTNTRAIDFGDLDGDSDLDIIWCHTSPDYNCEVWTNDGLGNFTNTSPNINEGNGGLTLDIFDADNDGDVDVAIGTRIFHNDGTGAFTLSEVLTGVSFTYDVRRGDLNGDGYFDLVIAAWSGSQFDKVYMNDGDGTFTFSQDISANQCIAIELDDFNGDGFDDLIKLAYEGNELWLNDGAGNLSQSIAPLGAIGSMQEVKTFDLELDGDMDIYIVSFSTANEVWVNDGNANFTAGPQPSSNGQRSVSIGDIDGDLDQDIILDGSKIHTNELLVPATDNCTLQNNLTYAFSPSTFDCTDAGSTISVTIGVTDASNNTSSCTIQLTVQDDVPPVALCKDITLQLDPTGVKSLVAADIDNGSSDNCNIASSVVSQSSFDCAHVGTNNVTLTITDDEGNMTDCTSVVTITEDPPVAICKDITVQLDGLGVASIMPSDIDNGSTGNCTSLAIDISSFDCTMLGANMVTLTASTPSGASNNCMAEVFVEENASIPCPLDTFCLNTVENSFGSNPAGFNYYGKSLSLDHGGTLYGTASDGEGGSSPAGEAYMYSYDGTTWNETILTPSNGISGDDFGFSIDVESERVVVGAPYRDLPSANEGAIYVYDYDGTNWTETYIEAQFPLFSAQFGYAVDLDGDRIAVGARGSGGDIHIFDWDGTNWIETKIENVGGADIYLDGDALISSKTSANGGEGEVNIFNFDGSNWNLVHTITPSNGVANLRFGTSLAYHDNRLVVGAGAGVTLPNGAWLYEYDGTNWNETILPLTGLTGGEQAGYDVDVYGDDILVGAPNYGSDGTVYHYQWDGTTWTENLLSSPNPDADFGYKVAMGAGLSLISGRFDDTSGFNAGAVFRYTCDLCLDINAISADPIPDGTYSAKITVISNTEVPANGSVIMHAGTQICLEPGFEVEIGAQFEAYIGPCN